MTEDGPPQTDTGDDDDGGGSRRGALVALILVVLLVVGGLWLTQRLRAMASIQDCVASGRSNCAPIGK